MPDPPNPNSDPAPTDIPSHVGRPSPVFLSTYWPMVHSAQLPGPRREEALGHLVQQYAPALKHFVRNRYGFDDDTADDLVHDFIVNKVLRRDLVARAERQRGKFRSFLMGAIQNFAVDFLRRQNAQKRIPPHALVAVDDLPPGTEPAAPDPETESAFDNAFVRQVLATAVHRLNQHCTNTGQHDTWTVFYHRMLAPTFGTAEPTPYRQLARQLGYPSEGDARNRLISAKRIFKRELESVVSEYTDDSTAAADELQELRDLLA